MAEYNEVMEKLNYLDDTKLHIKNAIMEKGQEITDLDTFRDYVAKILDIDSGKVKLFNNEEDMYADKQAKDGDLALVYDTTYKDIEMYVMFNEIIIPKHITLGVSALNTSYNMYMQPQSSHWYNRVIVNVRGTDGESNATIHISALSSKSSLSFDYISTNEEQTEFEFQYGTINSEEIEFDTDFISFEFEESVMWTSGSFDVFGGIFRTRNIYFGGIYQYKLNKLQDDTIYYGNNPRVDGNTLNAEFDYVDWLDMKTITNKVIELSNTTYVSGICVINSVKTINNKKVLDVFDIYNSTHYLLQYNNKLYVFRASYDAESGIDNFIANNKATKQHFDISNLQYSEDKITYTKLPITINDKTYYYAVVEEISSEDNITDWTYSLNGGSGNNLNIANPELLNSISMKNMSIMGYYEDKYFPAPTQLTAEDDSYIITGKVAYGKNGIITGDGTYLKHTTTNEFRNFFMPQLPTTYDSISGYSILQNGKQVPYYTFVNRKNIKCTDVDNISEDDALLVKLETLVQGTYESELFNTIYNATYHRTFYCDDGGRLYFGYFGYNMSDKQSSSSSGGTVHEEFRQIYGLLICLNDMSVYRTCNYTTTWRPFNGWGNNHEDPNADLAYLNYDFLNDEFVAVVDTGSWAWTGSDAPYLAMLKINATTGSATPYRWQIGRNGVPYSYAQVTDVRYDITTKKLIIPMSSWNSDSSSSVERILKMDLNGNKSIWIQNGYNLHSYSYLGDEESFYTLEPIYFYTYTDGNNVTHQCLKRIDDDRQVELVSPYSMYNDNRRYIYNKCLYYISNEQQTNNKYPIYKVDLETMTNEKCGEIPNYNSAYFVLYNKVPHIVYNNFIHSLDDMEEPMFIFYNTNQMYNDVRVDGVEVVEGNIQGQYPKAIISSSGITFVKNRQILYQFINVADYKDISDDVFMVWPNVGNNVYSKQYMYLGIQIGSGMASTLTPSEFIQAKQLVNSMLGGAQSPSPEIEYINRCNELAKEIIGE